MFEKSLEETPYKLHKGMREEPPNVSMKDIEKANQSNDNTSNTINPQGSLNPFTPRD